MLAAPGATIDVAPGTVRFVAPYELILGQAQQLLLSQVQQGLLHLSLLVTFNLIVINQNKLWALLVGSNFRIL